MNKKTNTIHRPVVMLSPHVIRDNNEVEVRSNDESIIVNCRCGAVFNWGIAKARNIECINEKCKLHLKLIDDKNHEKENTDNKKKKVS